MRLLRAGRFGPAYLPLPGARAVAGPDADGHGDPLPAGAVARLDTDRLRLQGWITSPVFSHNRKILASGVNRGKP
jgi:hypothetical protein